MIINLEENRLEKWKAEKARREQEEKARRSAETAECNNFRQWLERALPGEEFQYFLGEHIVGKRIAQVAMSAYERGLIVLFQKRSGGQFAYWARKRGRKDV